MEVPLPLSDEALALRADWYLRRGEIGVYTPRPLAMRVAGLKGDESRLTSLDTDLAVTTLLGASQKKRTNDGPFAERWNATESALAGAAEAYRAWRDHLREFFDAERRPPKRVPAQIVVELLGRASVLARRGWELFVPDPPAGAHNPYLVARVSLAVGLFEPYLALAELLYLELPEAMGDLAPYRGSFARRGYDDALGFLARAAEKLGLALDNLAVLGAPLPADAAALPGTTVSGGGVSRTGDVRRVHRHRFVALDNPGVGLTALEVELGGPAEEPRPAAGPSPIEEPPRILIENPPPMPLPVMVGPADPADTTPLPEPPPRRARRPRTLVPEPSLAAAPRLPPEPLPDPSLAIDVAHLIAARPPPEPAALPPEPAALPPTLAALPPGDAAPPPEDEAATAPPMRLGPADPLLQLVKVLRSDPALAADLDALLSGPIRPVLFHVRNDLARSRWLQTTVRGPGLGYLTAWEALHAALECRRDEIEVLLGALHGHAPIDPVVRDRLLASLPTPRDPRPAAQGMLREWIVDRVIADWIRLRQLLDEALPVEVPDAGVTPAGDTEAIVNAFVSLYGRTYIHLPLYGDALPAVPLRRREVLATELLDCDAPPQGCAPGRLARVLRPYLANEPAVAEFLA